MDKVPLPGSWQQPPPGSRRIGIASDELLSVSVILRPRSSRGERFPERPTHERLSHEEFEAVHGADPNDVAAVEAFAKDNDVPIVAVNLAMRTVFLSGSAASFSRAFQVDIGRFKYEGQEFRIHTALIYIPADLLPIVQGIIGLSNWPILRSLGGGALTQPPVQISLSDASSSYNFPTGVDGTGQTVAILAPGGGYQRGDLALFFGSSIPTIIDVPIEDPVTHARGVNQPNGLNAGETTTDIEIVGTVAPGATIAVYFPPSQDIFGLLTALNAAVHDVIIDPSIITISFGDLEEADPTEILFTLQLIGNGLMQDATTLNKTVLVASGDHGSSTGILYPASCPNATACGGTVLPGPGGALIGEVAWNNGGGGVSDCFPMPPYQQSAGVPSSRTNANSALAQRRGIPDVAGHAFAYNGGVFNGVVDPLLLSGSSVVAPLWAGLIALINQLKGRSTGFLNTILYSRLGPSAALNDVIGGDNGAYQAVVGWDACTGWGSPNGGALAAAIGPPTISSILPSFGAVGSPHPVVIRGQRLIDTSSVFFGPNSATIISRLDDAISVQPPAASTDDTVDVTLSTTSGGASALNPNDQFSYFFPIPVVISISPNSGSVAGGDPISINGRFLTGATAVNWVGPSLTVIVALHPDPVTGLPPNSNDFQISTTTPSDFSDAGPVNVTLTTPGGTSSLTQFSFV